MPTVLIVEDHHDCREMMARALAWYGYGVLTAPDGVSAVKQASNARPDIILMDLNLPGITGYQAISQLKHHAQTQGIPVIAVTGCQMDEQMRSRMLEAGYAALESKPIDIDRLRHKMRLLLLS
ncbi:MAG: response regulator [Roseiflexaceae bacterium]